MIIWINGAFGAGKTQIAYELYRRMENSYVYDPENTGFFIRKNMPEAICMEDFQDYPMWRSFNLEMLLYISERYKGNIIVPMTITDKGYYDEIIEALSYRYDVRHIILYAEKKTILKRLASRLEGGNSWAAAQIDRCIAAFEGDITETKIYTDDMNIYQVVDKIGEVLGLDLVRDDRGRMRRTIDRMITKIKHIR